MIFSSFFAFNLKSAGKSPCSKGMQPIGFIEKVRDCATLHTRLQHVFFPMFLLPWIFLQVPEALAEAFFIHWPLALLRADISSSNFQVAEKDQTRCCQRYHDSFCLNKTISVAGLNVLNDLPSKTMTATGYPRIRWSSYIQRQLSFISYSRWIS